MSLDRRRLAALALAFTMSLCGSALAAAAGADIPPEPGEKWKVTTSMSAMGMNMPGRTMEVCAPKNTDQAPVETSKECQILDRRRSGNKETMRMVCTGREKMEGTMEIEYLGKDHYRGKMLAKTSDGEMQMNYEGQKLGGECDAAEMKRKVAQFQDQANAMTAKMCADSAKNVEPSYFVGPNALCKDPKDRQVFCANVQTHASFLAISQRDAMTRQMTTPGGDLLGGSAAVCGFKVDTVRSTLCASAEGKEQWKFLVGECPAIADPIAKRECAGRNFTNPPAPRYRDFCSAWNSRRNGGPLPGSDGTMQAGGGSGSSGGGASSSSGEQGGKQGSTDNAEQKPGAGDAVKGVLKSVDKLRGIFGR